MAPTLITIHKTLQGTSTWNSPRESFLLCFEHVGQTEVDDFFPCLVNLGYKNFYIELIQGKYCIFLAKSPDPLNQGRYTPRLFMGDSVLLEKAKERVFNLINDYPIFNDNLILNEELYD